MCCTFRPAHLSKTILYAGEAMHDGRVVHVVGYQNRARNLFDGPNAMILPFPAAGRMGPSNCLDGTGMRWFMNDLADAVRPPIPAAAFGRTRGLVLGSAKSVAVFDSGEYTVVLADDARDIPSALERVPEDRRPQLNNAIFDAYAKWYPNWPIALCCFYSRRELEAEPLLWWFEPSNKDVLWAPALDSHSGHAPDLKAEVRVDHSVVFGSARTPRGITVRYRRVVPGHVMPFFAGKVVGDEFRSSLKNGDFAIALSDLTSIPEDALRNDVKIHRISPPGANRPGQSRVELS